MVERELYQQGEAIRRQLRGDADFMRNKREYDKDPVMKKFIDVATETVFGALWSRPGLDFKTRTLICVVSDAATGQPTILHAAADGPAVGIELACPDVVMPALVVEDEQAHGCRLTGQQRGIDHEQLGCRHRYAEIGQAGIERVANAAAFQRSPGNLQAAIRL
jgi:hypothetical protein